MFVTRPVLTMHSASEFDGTCRSSGLRVMLRVAASLVVDGRSAGEVDDGRRRRLRRRVAARGC